MSLHFEFLSAHGEIVPRGPKKGQECFVLIIFSLVGQNLKSIYSGSPAHVLPEQVPVEGTPNTYNKKLLDKKLDPRISIS